jgi:hypothetical protein
MPFIEGFLVAELLFCPLETVTAASFGEVMVVNTNLICHRPFRPGRGVQPRCYWYDLHNFIQCKHICWPRNTSSTYEYGPSSQHNCSRRLILEFENLVCQGFTPFLCGLWSTGFLVVGP